MPMNVQVASLVSELLGLYSKTEHYMGEDFQNTSAYRHAKTLLPCAVITVD